MIYVIRVTTGQEKIIAEMLAKKAKAEKLFIYSVVNIENVKGYLFVEAEDENNITKLTQKMKNVKGFLKQAIQVSEIQNLINIANKPNVSIKIGDIVEMTSGPFKGEKARVIKLDEAKDQYTVELIEVAVPIPVTINSKTARLAQKAEDADN